MALSLFISMSVVYGTILKNNNIHTISFSIKGSNFARFMVRFF
jgi:hypothetical protein